MSYLRRTEYLVSAYPTLSPLGRNAAAFAYKPSGAGPRAVSVCSAKLVAKGARLAGISNAPVAPKTRFAKPLRRAGGSVERIVPGLVGGICSGSKSVVPLTDLRAAARTRFFFGCRSRVLHGRACLTPS